MGHRGEVHFNFEVGNEFLEPFIDELGAVIGHYHLWDAEFAYDAFQMNLCISSVDIAAKGSTSIHLVR